MSACGLKALMQHVWIYLWLNILLLHQAMTTSDRGTIARRHDQYLVVSALALCQH
jgi:hypothetical protein